jgi:hypothetical protein
MRSIFALATCSLLAILPSCSDKQPAGVHSPPPSETPDGGEANDPADASTKPLVLDLGEVEAGTEATFEIPEGALGFNITAEGERADFSTPRPFGIERITAPDGTVVHDKFTPTGGTLPTSLALFDAIASASVPQSDNAPQNLAGKWKVRFGVQGVTTSRPKLKGTVRVQSSGDGAFHGGRLDVVIHVPKDLRIGGRTIDSANAADDPDIAERIDVYFGLTSQLLGIERGEVRFQEEDASYRELDSEDELLSGFAISKGEKDGTQVFHILLTNVIAKDGRPFATGLSGGIPGAATVFGRGVSGIIVTASNVGEVDANTMLHETGHFFGLNHTTEGNGRTSDPLSDTPVCENISRDPDVLLQCPDRTNLMFVAGPMEGPVTLSPTQTRVYRGSPIYRALPASSGSTMALDVPRTLPTFKRTFRASGSAVLSPVERELSLGFCGHNALDADGLAKRHGRAAAIAQLRAAAADQDLLPYIRGRASLALKTLGEE